MEEKTDDQTSSAKFGSGRNKAATAVQFFLRGLAITLPSVLTFVILLWIGGAIYDYVISPVSILARFTIAQLIDASRPTDTLVTVPNLPPLEHFAKNEYWITPELRDELREKLKTGEPVESEPLPGDENEKRPTKSQRRADNDTMSPTQKIILANFVRKNYNGIFIPVGSDEPQFAVPYNDYIIVVVRTEPTKMPRSVTRFYMVLVTEKYFFGLFHLSAVAVLISVIALYFIGRVVTARLGAWFVQKFETMFLARLPLISNIYSSVKQVTDFVFSERTVEYNRVVAVEYPRRGIWSIGFVTGDSMLTITAASGEPMVSVLIPSSPMPVTGYTMNIPRSEVLDLDISIDQAFQFCVSCGVLVPEQQKVTTELLQKELAKRLVGAGSALPPAIVLPPTVSPSEEASSPNEEASPPTEGPEENGTTL